jgi:hypothetical protein
MNVLKGMRLRSTWKIFKNLYNIEKCWLQYYAIKYELDLQEFDSTLDYYENKDSVSYKMNKFLFI